MVHITNDAISFSPIVMAITPPCAIGCPANDETPTQHQTPVAESSHLYPESIKSLSSKPSLPSLPSLNLHLQQPSTLHQCISTLTGHSSYISALAVHGKSLYTGSSNQEIRAWNSNPSDPNTGGPANSSHVVAICRGPVKSLAISGNKLFSGHQDHKICVWRINPNQNHNYKLQAILPTPKDRLLSLLSPKNYVQVHRHKTCTWVHHVDTISALALSHDGFLLYSVSWDRTLKIWRTSDFKCMESVASAHQDAINAIVVSSDGIVYTGSADTRIKMWKRLAGEKKHSLIGTLDRHKSAVNALALSSDGSVLYSGACDRSVVVWERANGSSMAATGALRGHTMAILCLATVTSDLVCSGSADKTIRVWIRRGGDKISYSCLAVLEGHRGPIKCISMVTVESSVAGTCGNSSHLVYSGSLDCDVRVWKLLIPPL